MGTRVVYIGATADEAGQLSNEVGRIGVSIDLGPLSQIIIFYLSNLIAITQFLYSIYSSSLQFWPLSCTDCRKRSFEVGIKVLCLLQTL